MAEILSQTDVVEVKRHIEDIGKTLTTKQMINPLRGDSFESLPLAIQKVIETGGFEPFETEAQLLASRPTLTKKASYALDTHKIFLWGGSAWKNTGLSVLERANQDATTKANAAEANAKAYVNSNDGATRYDSSAFYEAKYYNVNGVGTSNANSAATDLIPVKAGDKVSVFTKVSSATYAAILVYNSAGTFVRSVVPSVFSTPTETITTIEADGFVRSQWMAGGTPLSDKDGVAKVVLNEGATRFLTKDALTDGIIPLDSVTGFIPSDSLFNPSTASLTTYVNNNTGGFSSNNSFPNTIRSDYIPVSPSTEYEMSFIDITSLYAEYDSNKVFIRGGQGRLNNKFTTSLTTAFVVVNLNKDILNEYYFIKSGDEGLESFTWLNLKLQQALKDVQLSHNDSRFKDKKLLVSGDSITEVNFRATKNWHSYLRDWLGFSQVQNDAVSGSGLVKSGSGVGMNYRLADWEVNYDMPDLILLMGNMNDGTSGATGAWDWIYGAGDAHKGDFTTVVDTSNMASSLWYALRYLFETLITKYPNVPIGFIISQPRFQEATKSGAVRAGYATTCWGDNGWFAEWSDVIERVSSHYSIPTLNLYSQSNLRPWNAVNNATYFSSNASLDGDGIHPNALGHELMAQKICEFTKQFV